MVEMVRHYKRQVGSRLYVNYSEQALQQCLSAVRNKETTQRKAAQFFGVPRSTIRNKLQGLNTKSCGGQTVFSSEDEQSFKEHLLKIQSFGFPVTEADLRHIVTSHLEKNDIIISKFKNNIPGPDWIRSFLKRHPDLKTLIENNVKKCRAQVDESVIDEYFEKLAEELYGVSPDCIFNFDETNLSDDPARTSVLSKRGSKYVDKNANTSKAATSIMLCGSATGELLPPYVVYRAERLYKCWTENGPSECLYNISKSGWLDENAFESWFELMLLPILKRKGAQKKVLICDNLSSHISLDIIQLCEQNNIRFVCIPSNSMRLIQPLAIAFFTSLKRTWRTLLLQWNRKSSNSKFSAVPKIHFPRLLRDLYTSVIRNDTGEETLISAFRECGIYPLDKNEVLDRLRRETMHNDIIGDVSMNNLFTEKVKDDLNSSMNEIKRQKFDERLSDEKYSPNNIADIKIEDLSDSDIYDESSPSFSADIESDIKIIVWPGMPGNEYLRDAIMYDDSDDASSSIRTEDGPEVNSTKRGNRKRSRKRNKKKQINVISADDRNSIVEGENGNAYGNTDIDVGNVSNMDTHASVHQSVYFYLDEFE